MTRQCPAEVARWAARIEAIAAAAIARADEDDRLADTFAGRAILAKRNLPKEPRP